MRSNSNMMALSPCGSLFAIKHSIDDITVLGIKVAKLLRSDFTPDPV